MKNEVKFRRCPLYKDTYLAKIKTHESLRSKLRDFMELKRHDPGRPFGGSDKPFIPNGKFGSKIPGIRHAHLNRDLSLVYRFDPNQTEIWLYGIFSHDELGTGQPANINRQDSIATKLSNQQCEVPNLSINQNINKK